jgi:hypothetical protein
LKRDSAEESIFSSSLSGAAILVDTVNATMEMIRKGRI